MKKASENARFPANPLYRVAEFPASMGKIDAAHIPQLNSFELLPEALTRIQVRGIRREPFDVEALRRAIGQELFDHVTAMNRGPIPDQHHAAGHLAQQMLQKGDHVV